MIKITVVASILLLAGAQAVWAKSLSACADEYAANAGKIEGTQSRDDFLAACQKGQEVVSGATTTSRPAVPPATVAKQPATPPKAAGEAEKPAAPP